MPFFRKKPVAIEARRFDLEASQDIDRLRDPRRICVGQTPLEQWCDGSIRGVCLPPEARLLEVRTLEGDYAAASVGDWIVEGVKGEFYPVKPAIFEALYDEESDAPPVESPADDPAVSLQDVGAGKD